jgi:hypothetical protein
MSWMSKRKSIIALSSSKVEYVVATKATKEVVWLLRLCNNIGIKQGSLEIECDSQSAIAMAKKPLTIPRVSILM